MHIDLSEAAEKAIRFVRESKNIAYDTESSGLDWRYHNPVGYVVAAPEKDGSIRPENSVYIPVRHGGGGNLPGGRPLETPTDKIEQHPFELELNKAFAERNRVNTEGRTVGHNMKFDVHMSANGGVMLGRRLACTQNMQAILNEYQRSFSLDSCATEHGVTAKKGDELYAHMARLFGGAPERSQMQHFWRLSGTDPIAYDYTVGDGITTWELYVSQNEKIVEEEVDVVCDLENDLIWTVFRMERKGIRVDVTRMQELRQATEASISEALKQFPMGFNTRSPVQMKEAMDAAGYTDYPVTALGNPSFTEKWLKKNPLGREVVKIRQASNLINSFINPLETTHMFKGRVHATLNQLKSDNTGTISGRFSCSEPNLQQVPKRIKELAKPFRQLFIPDDGYVFWERDYSQCEPRLFAHYSQDENLLAGYNAKPFVDAHQVVANLLNVERDPTAKRMNMGIFTGMQIRSFADHMGWPVDKAGDAWHKWFKAFPGVRGFQSKAKDRLASRGYVYTLLKRRCRLESARFAYRGTSKIIQGGNADIVKYMLLHADRMCEDNGDIVQILMTVHDSYNGQFQDTPEARKLFEEMVAFMSEVQTEPFNLTVPFVMEGHEGANWSIATYGGE